MVRRRKNGFLHALPPFSMVNPFALLISAGAIHNWKGEREPTSTSGQFWPSCFSSIFRAQLPILKLLTVISDGQPFSPTSRSSRTARFLFCSILRAERFSLLSPLTVQNNPAPTEILYHSSTDSAWPIECFNLTSENARFVISCQVYSKSYRKSQDSYETGVNSIPHPIKRIKTLFGKPFFVFVFVFVYPLLVK